jgi:hypothetical protein
MSTTPDLSNRFEYHPPKDDTTREKHEDVRGICFTAAHHFDEMLPEGREKALAITKMEEAMFWANAAIARSQ